MNATWCVRIERLETQLRVGVLAEETDPQPVWVSMTIRGEAAAAPASLDECIDYLPVCKWITQVWPSTQHTPLLETRINELASFVFEQDARIHEVQICIAKERVSRNAFAIGLERTVSRSAI